VATFTRESARYASGPRHVVTRPEAADQSFKEGEFVYTSSGKATVCASNATTILGIALHDASGTENTDVKVLLAHPDTVFSMTTYEDGGGSNDTIAYTDLGVKYAHVVVSNIHMVDTGDTDYDAWVIREFIDEIGDIYPRVLASVIPAAFQGGAAAS